MSEMVSVAKARRILGSLANSMSDTQVQELLICLHLLAKEQLWYNGSKVNGVLSNEQSKESINET